MLENKIQRIREIQSKLNLQLQTYGTSDESLLQELIELMSSIPKEEAEKLILNPGI